MKMKQKHIVRYIAAFTLALAFVFITPSCKKYKDPTPAPAPTGPSVTIQQLRNMYAGVSIPFTTNKILNAVVTCDEASGSLYKQVYIRDNSGIFSATHNYGAISVHFTSGTHGYLSVGDSVAINLNGCSLNKSGGGSLEIDSAVVTRVGQITHLGLSKSIPQPISTTISQIDTFVNAVGGGFIFDGQLVQLTNIEFISSNVGTMYAVPQSPTVPPQSVNKYINDFAGNTIVAYNSGYSNYAGNAIPANSGTITAITNLYTNMQITLRNYEDIVLTNPYQQIMYDVLPSPTPTTFPPFWNGMYQALSKSNPVVAAGWSTIAYKGSLVWDGGQYGNPNTANSIPPNWTYHPAASNYQTPDTINDMWFISPPIVDHGTPKYIDFSTAMQYGTNKRLLSVFVSRTFDGTHIDPSQWQDVSSLFPGISAISSNGANPSFRYAAHTTSAFTANPIPITVSGSGSSFYLAFRYQSNKNVTDSTGSTYLIGSLVLHN